MVPRAASQHRPCAVPKAVRAYEGNMRMPTLAWWPGKIPAGSVTSEIGRSIDILPTLAKLCGAKVPTDRIIDGKNISFLLTDPKAKSPHSELYYEYEGHPPRKVEACPSKQRFPTSSTYRKTLANRKISPPITQKKWLLCAPFLRPIKRKSPAPVALPARRRTLNPSLKKPGELPTLAEYHEPRRS